MGFEAMTQFAANEENPQLNAKYVAPRLTVIGSLELITQATGSGGYIDGVYPRHTPVKGHTQDYS